MAQFEARPSTRLVPTKGGDFVVTTRVYPETDLPLDASANFAAKIEQTLGGRAQVIFGEADFIQGFPGIVGNRMFKRMKKAGERLTTPVIGDVGTVDKLVSGERFIFSAETGAEVMHTAGLISPSQHKVFELGAAAGVDPLGEVRVAGLILSDEGSVVRRSADKVVTMPGEDIVVGHPHSNDRQLLSHAWYSGNGGRENIIYGYIEAGNGKSDILDVIRGAAETIGLQNYAMAITVEGEDLLVNGAVLNKMPDKPLDTVSDLVAIQERRLIRPGLVDAIGTVFAERTDVEFKEMQQRSGLEPKGYTSHFHSDVGGHIVSIIPGESSKIYFVLSPVDTTADIQPATPELVKQLIKEKFKVADVIDFSVPDNMPLTPKQVEQLQFEQGVLKELVGERIAEIETGVSNEKILEVMGCIHRATDGITELNEEFLYPQLADGHHRVSWKKVAEIAQGVLDANRNAQIFSNDTFGNNAHELPEIDRLALKIIAGRQIAGLAATLTNIAALSGELTSHQDAAAVRVAVNTKIKEYSSDRSGDFILEFVYPAVRDHMQAWHKKRGDATGVFAATEYLVKKHPELAPIVSQMVSVDERGTDFTTIAHAQMVYWEAGSDIDYFGLFQGGLGPFSEPLKQVKEHMADLAAQVIDYKVSRGGSAKVLDLGTGFDKNRTGYLPQYAVPGLIIDRLRDQQVRDAAYFGLSDVSGVALSAIAPAAKDREDDLFYIDMAKGELPLTRSGDLWDVLTASLSTHQLTYQQMRQFFHEANVKLDLGGYLFLNTVGDQGVSQWTQIPTNLTDSENRDLQPPFTVGKTLGTKSKKVRNSGDVYDPDTRVEMPLQWLVTERTDGNYDVLVPVQRLMIDVPIYGVQVYQKQVYTLEELKRVQRRKEWLDLIDR